jgi:hypothetical protein
MSDLANSCEYLTSEKLCLAVLESEKAKTARQVRCKNEEKTTCCYLCMYVFDCATPCRFLGSGNHEPPQVDSEKIPLESSSTKKQTPEEDKTKNNPVMRCLFCDVEMAQTRTKFRIDGWEGSHKKQLVDGTGQLETEVLPVIVYLCPKCSKIEFKADEKRDKE